MTTSRFDRFATGLIGVGLVLGFVTLASSVEVQWRTLSHESSYAQPSSQRSSPVRIKGHPMYVSSIDAERWRLTMPLLMVSFLLVGAGRAGRWTR